jgi:hypothetical protein
VLHPSFGLSWFGKLDDGQEREENAKILFTFAYEAYKKIYDDEKAAAGTSTDKSRTRSRPGTAASFLDDVCMLDSDDDAPETGALSELDQFLVAYRTYGRGDRDRPLLWWKVCLSLQF